MSSFGKLIFGFLIAAMCVVGSLMIFSQNLSAPVGEFNIGNGSINVNATSAINQTTQMLVSTTNIASSSFAVALLIFGAIGVIGALALVAGRKR